MKKLLILTAAVLVARSFGTAVAQGPREATPALASFAEPGISPDGSIPGKIRSSTQPSPSCSNRLAQTERRRRRGPGEFRT